jgi:surfactin synthase thioesterase subunit
MQSPGGRDRLTATRALEFARLLEQMAKTGKVLYQDDRFVLFQVSHGGGS